MKNSKTLILVAAALTISSSVVLRAVPEPSIMASADSSDVRVFPNPWRSDKHATSPVTFDHLPPNATIKLFTISGRCIKSIEASNTSATWDCANEQGEKVASGVYLYSITDVLGNETSGKIAVIR